MLIFWINLVIVLCFTPCFFFWFSHFLTNNFQFFFFYYCKKYTLQVIGSYHLIALCMLASQYIVFHHFIFLPWELISRTDYLEKLQSALCFEVLRKAFFSNIISFGIFFNKSWTVYAIYCFCLSLWPSSGDTLNHISFVFLPDSSFREINQSFVVLVYWDRKLTFS